MSETYRFLSYHSNHGGHQTKLQFLCIYHHTSRRHVLSRFGPVWWSLAMLYPYRYIIITIIVVITIVIIDIIVISNNYNYQF